MFNHATKPGGFVTFGQGGGIVVATGSNTEVGQISHPIDQERIQMEAECLAKQGLRVLALAKKAVLKQQRTLEHTDLDAELTFLGLQGMIDPPREEAIAAVDACQSAGIQVKMITGDHLTTATEIAERIGLKNRDNWLASLANS
ncbi:hypothetical protein [Leptodesmis sp.]|uniref:hypothetical protein n=1 Tax=Leptodesmis sp. TaxID=3100501 RepID=UPI0040535107